MRLRCFQCFAATCLTRTRRLRHAFCSQRCVESYNFGRAKKQEKPPHELVELFR